MNKRIIFSDNGTLSDFSVELDKYKSGTKVMPFVAADDYLFIGSRLPFNHFYFKLSVLNILPSSMSIDYWSTNGWNSMVELTDETAGLTASGYVTFTPDEEAPWTMANTNGSGQTITGLETVTIYNMFWLRISFSADLSLTTALQWIGNIFSNDDDLYAEFPDFSKADNLTSFQSGKTDWQEQAVVAANVIIQDLIDDRIIDDGSQILIKEDFRLPSVAKVAEIIFRAFGDDYIDDRKEVREEYKQRMKKRVPRIDKNKNGKEEVFERSSTSGWLSR